MSGSSNFLQMNASFTDADSDVAYAASTQIASGFSAGIVPSSPWNKFCIQVSTMVAAIGTVLANLGWVVSDASMSGVVTALTAAFTSFAGVNAQVGTTYTVLTGDRHKLVTLSNASAIAVTLPQAGSAGFTNQYKTKLVNLGVGTVTITPTTSTIDGAATLTLTTGQSVEIFSNETNYITARRSAFTAYNLSANITLTAAGSWSVTHGLGQAPKGIQLWLVNTSAELGYAVGDRAVVSSDNAHGTNDLGAGATILSGNTTTIVGRFGATAAIFFIPNKTNGVNSGIDPTKWALQVASWA